MAQHPQGLEPIVFECGRRASELGQPGLHSRHHFSFRPTGKFDPGPVTHPVDRIGKQRHQLRHLTTGDRHRLGHRCVSHHHPVDPAMDPIATGIAQVVLHVADDRVLPVGEIDGAIRAHLQIGRPEIRIARRHDRLHLDRLWKRGVAGLELILQDPLKADHIAHQQIPLQAAGEMCAGEKLDAGAGAGALVVNTRGATMLVHPIEPRGEDRAPVGHRSGAVDGDVVSPGAEGMPVRIGECIGGVEAKLASAGLILEDGAVGTAHRRPPRGFPLRVMERAFLKIERAGGIERETIGGVVRVGGVETADDPGFDVVAIVAVGVLQIEHIRPLRHNHTLPPEFKSGRIVEIAGKGLHLVGTAVAVGVFQNQQLVVHRLVGTPVGIGWPSGHPQPSLGVKRHLHRIDQLREHHLVGDQFHLHAGVDGHLGN